MSNVYGVNGTAGVSYAMDASVTYISPDALLAYCQMQLGGLDGEITTQMKAQQSQLHEREAVESVQSTLESFGTQGPVKPEQMTTCVAAFQKAIASLPSDDPAGILLQQQCDTMTHTYGYNPPSTAEVTGPHNVTRIVPTTESMGHPPQNDDWRGTTDAINNLVGDIKSNAEIQMLTLQDLVSQRQQAVQLASGMMSKEDQTLEAQAKAIGQ